MATWIVYRPTYAVSGVTFGQNVLSFLDISGTFNQSTVNSLDALWKTFLQDTINQEVDCLTGNQVVEMTDGVVVDELFSTTGAVAGGSTGDLAPLNSCYGMRINAGVGRHRKGRVFLPGVDEGKVSDGGVLVGTTAADIVANLEIFVADTIGTLGYLFGVWSRALDLVSPIESAAVDPVVFTQRRRQYAL